jgi:hypothetical protein
MGGLKSKHNAFVNPSLLQEPGSSCRIATSFPIHLHRPAEVSLPGHLHTRGHEG